MKYGLFFICLFFMFNFVSAGLYYEVSLDFRGDYVNVGSIDIVYDRVGYLNPSDEKLRTFDFNLVSGSGDVIYSESVGIMDFDFYENLTLDNDSASNSEIVRLEEFSRVVYLPYNEDVRNILIYDDSGEQIGDVPLDMFNEVNVDSVLDDGGVVVGRSSFGLINYLVWLVLILVLISVIVYFYVFKNHSKKK